MSYIKKTIIGSQTTTNTVDAFDDRKGAFDYFLRRISHERDIGSLWSCSYDDTPFGSYGYHSRPFMVIEYEIPTNRLTAREEFYVR